MKLQETLEALEKSTKDLTKSIEDAKPVEDDKPESPAEAPVEAPKEDDQEAPKEAEPEVPVEAPKEDEQEAPAEAPKEDDQEAPVEAPKEAEPEAPEEKTEKSVDIDRDLVIKSLDTLNLALDVIKSMSTPEARQDNMSKSVAETPDAKHTEDVNGGKQSSAVVKGADCDDPDMKDGKKKDKVSKDDDGDDEVEESAKKSADKDSAEKCDGDGEMSDDKKKDKEDDATKSVTGKAVQSEDVIEKSDKADEPSKDEIIKSFRKQVSDALDDSDSDVMAGPNSARSNKLREVLSEANKSTELSDDLKKSFFDIK